MTNQAEYAILPFAKSYFRKENLMNVFEAALLGLLQGLGEFLPISSSGHLLLGRMVLGLTIDESPAYKMLDILLHVGTLIPIIVYTVLVCAALYPLCGLIRRIGRG
jgi:undecaprenyl pyrophosphate phosphatase UppP